MRYTRRDLVVGGGLVALSQAFPAHRAEARKKMLFGNYAAPLPPVAALERLGIDAGGYCLNVHVDWYSLTGLRVVSVDTVGCYIYNPTTKAHTQLITTASVPFSSTSPGAVAETNFAPTNLNRFIALAQLDQDALVWTVIASENQGTLWRNTGLSCHIPVADALADFACRWATNRVVVDPNNPEVAYVGMLGYSDTNRGVWRTDHLSTVTNISGWTKITDVPDPSNSFGCAGIAFDVSGGTTTRDGITVTKNIIMPSSGNGVYLSTDGGVTAIQISDPAGVTGPNRVNFGEVFGLVGSSGTYDGWYWCTSALPAGADWEPLAVWKYKTGSGWTNVKQVAPPYTTTKNLPANFAACNQLASGDVQFIGNAFYSARTLDNGATLINNNQPGNLEAVMPPTYMGQTTSPVGNVEWVRWARTPGPGPSYSTGDQCQGSRDPLNTDRTITTQGVGVLYMDWPRTNATFYSGQHYVVDSLGIQQLEMDVIVSVPGSTAPLCGVRDRGILAPPNGTTMASTYVFELNFGHSWAIDWASDDPSYCIATISFPASINFAIIGSANYGTQGSWTDVKYNSTPPYYTFCQSVACLSSQKFIFVGSDQAQTASLVYTTNGGASFSASAGINNLHWNFVQFSQWTVLAADRVTPSTYYAIVPTVGIYKSSNDGANFSLQSGPLSGFNDSAYLINIMSVPGHAGHLLLSSSGGTNSVYHSPDGGVTRNNIATGFDSTYVATIGAQAVGGTYPRIVISGVRTGIAGFKAYYSDDMGVTWNLFFDYAAITPRMSLRITTLSNNDAKVFYIGSGYAGQGGYKFTSLV